MIPQDLYDQILENIPIVCVDVVILNSNDEVLLIKRNQPPAKDQWWIPGGRLWKRESLSDCAKRKCLDEVGLNCRVDQMIMYDSTVFDTGPNDIPVHSVNFVFLCRVDGLGEVKIDDTISGYKWVNKIPEWSNSYVAKALYKVGLI